MPLPLTAVANDCWNQIGVWGDRSCPELSATVHCHNCPVFTAAGRRLLDRTSPTDYQDEWAKRLAEPEEIVTRDLHSVLNFRIGEEWLALPVQTLIEVIPTRPVHRIPFRSGLLAGLINVRGELHLAVRLDRLLGISNEVGDESTASTTSEPGAKQPTPRLLLASHGGETLAFPVDEVDRVYRFPADDLSAVPPTLRRAAARFARGVFRCENRAIGYLDDGRLFDALRAKLR
jgi:chemotaxis-related protein WspD